MLELVIGSSGVYHRTHHDSQLGWVWKLGIPKFIDSSWFIIILPYDGLFGGIPGIPHFQTYPLPYVEAAVISRDYVGDRLHHSTISRVQIKKKTYSQAKQCFRQLSSTPVKKQLGLFTRAKTYIRVCARMNWHLASLSLKWRSNMHEIWGFWQSLQTNPSHRLAICMGRSRNIRHD